jgi:tetratricopeptide (TPR) repeat protein
MRYTAILAASLAALLALAACTAGNVKSGMVKDCEQTRDLDLMVSGCTAVINSGKHSGRNHVAAYNNRGAAYYDLGEPTRAIEDYDQVLRLDPGDDRKYLVYDNRGNAFAELGEHARAIADYSEAIRLEPDFAKAFSNRGIEYDALGDYIRAIEDLDQALRLDPGDASYYNNRAFARCHLGQVEPSLEDWMQVVRLAAGAAEVIQGNLRDHGFYKGAINGDFDMASQKALREWTVAGCPTSDE